LKVVVQSFLQPTAGTQQSQGFSVVLGLTRLFKVVIYLRFGVTRYHLHFCYQLRLYQKTHGRLA